MKGNINMLEMRRLGESQDRNPFFDSLRPNDVFVVTFPKSGTNWISFFLACATKRKHPKRLSEPLNISTYRQVVPDVNIECFNGLPLDNYKNLPGPRIFSAHALYDSRFAKVIYAVRDPRDVALSYYYHQKRGVSGFNMTLDEYVSKNETYPSDWGKHVEGWIRNAGGKDFLFLKYENLHENPEYWFGRILDFVGISVTPDEFTALLEESSFENMRRLEERYGVAGANNDPGIYFMRQGTTGGWSKEMREETADLIVKRYEPVMRELGYETKGVARSTGNTKCWCGGELIDSPHESYGICKRCGTHVNLVRRTDGELQSFYGFDTYWHEQQKNVSGYPMIEERAALDFNDRIPAWFDLLRNLKLPSSLLEIGCAHGGFLQYAREHGVQTVVGVEPAEETCAYARSRFDLPFLISGLFPDVELPLPKYDAVVGFDVLEHFAEPVRALEAVTAILNDGAICLFQTPAYRGETKEWAQFRPQEHLFLFTQNSIRELFHRAGLEVIQILPGYFPDDMFVIGCKREDASLILAGIRQTGATKSIARRRMKTVTEQPSGVKNILWVRPDSIGDAVLASSMLPYIKKKYHNGKITVVCQTHIAELYETCPLVDEVIPLDKNRFITDNEYASRFLDQIGDLSVQVAINSVFSRDAVSDRITLAARADQHIALYGDSVNITVHDWEEANRRYTLLIPHNSEHRTEIQRHSDFLHALGVEHEELQPVVWTSDEDRAFADNFFTENGIRPDKAIVLFAGAQSELRRYEKYGEALSEICDEGDYTVIALGSPSDGELNNINLKNIKIATYDLSGKTTIRQSAEIIRRSRLAVGAETGLAHIACAVGTPNVILLGGGQFGRFMPYSPLTSIVSLPLECYGCNWHCKFIRAHCVQDVNVDVLAAAIRDALQSVSDKPRLYLHGSRYWKPKPWEPELTRVDDFVDLEGVNLIEMGSEATTNRDEGDSSGEEMNKSSDGEIDQSSYEEVLNEMERLERSGRVDLPFRVLNLTIDKFSSSLKLLNLLAEQKIKSNDKVAAREVLSDILSRNPAFIDALNNLAVLDMLEEKWQDAAHRIGEVLSLEPENIVAKGNLEFLKTSLATVKIELENENVMAAQSVLRGNANSLTATPGLRYESALNAPVSPRSEVSPHDQFYEKVRSPKRNSWITFSNGSEDRIAERLRRLGAKVYDLEIDVQDYRRYFELSGYAKRYEGYYSFNRIEKSLEHYIAATLLKLKSDDVYIDIASEGSPVPEIYSRLFGARTYKQDLSYPPGVNGDTIGGDASNLPLPEGFVSKMALHCSFEHFEGDSDIRFIREAERVLRPGGAVCIVPLYLAEEYAIQTDPVNAISEDVQFEPGVTVYCAKGWGNRHGRFYDPEQFVRRVVRNLGSLSLRVYRIKNAYKVDSSCYVQFAALIEKEESHRQVSAGEVSESSDRLNLATKHDRGPGSDDALQLRKYFSVDRQTHFDEKEALSVIHDFFSHQEEESYAHHKDNLNRYLLSLEPLRELPRDLRVLDIGRPPFASTLLMRHYIFDRVDVAVSAEEHLTQTASGHSEKIRLDKNDGSAHYAFEVQHFNLELYQWPYENERFDVLTCWEVFGQIARDPMLWLSEANRILKPEGILYLIVPNAISLSNAIKIIQGQQPANHFQYRTGSIDIRNHRDSTPDEIRILLESSGFEVEALETANFRPIESGGYSEQQLADICRLLGPLDQRKENIIVVGRKVSGTHQRHLSVPAEQGNQVENREDLVDLLKTNPSGFPGKEASVRQGKVMPNISISDLSYPRNAGASSPVPGTARSVESVKEQEKSRNSKEVEWWRHFIFSQFDSDATRSEQKFLQRFQSECTGRWRYITENIGQSMEFLRNGKALDIGNGPCGLLNFVPAKVKVGIDPNNMLYNDNGILYNLNNMSYVCCRAEALSLPTSFFDFVSCVNVLDHTNDPAVILKEIYRVLKPGGLFFLSVDTRLPGETSLVHPHAFTVNAISEMVYPLRLRQIRTDQPCYDAHPTNKRIDAWYEKQDS